MNEIKLDILKEVARLCLSVKDKNVSLLVKAPDEVLHSKGLGYEFFIFPGTNWAQSSDRNANWNTSAIKTGDGKGFYSGFYNKFLRIDKKLKKFLQVSDISKVIFGGFSQGAAIAQLFAKKYNLQGCAAYCLASPRVLSVSQKELKNVYIINHPKDVVRLLPVCGSYLGKEYFINEKKNKLVKVNKISKIIDFLFRKGKFDTMNSIHEESYYLRKIQLFSTVTHLKEKSLC